MVGTLVRECRCATSCDLDVIFLVSVVTLKILSRLYLGNHKV